MDRRDQRSQHLLEHVTLTVACAFVYHQVVGKPGSVKNAADLDRILNDVAHALSNVAPIYAGDGAGVAPRTLEPIELLHARSGQR